MKFPSCTYDVLNCVTLSTFESCKIKPEKYYLDRKLQFLVYGINFLKMFLHWTLLIIWNSFIFKFVFGLSFFFVSVYIRIICIFNYLSFDFFSCCFSFFCALKWARLSPDPFLGITTGWLWLESIIFTWFVLFAVVARARHLKEYMLIKLNSFLLDQVIILPKCVCIHANEVGLFVGWFRTMKRVAVDDQLKKSLLIYCILDWVPINHSIFMVAL